MTDYIITFVKTREPNNEEWDINSIGGINGNKIVDPLVKGSRHEIFHFSTEEVIRRIQSGSDTFLIMIGRRGLMEVVIGTRDGVEYVKTPNDVGNDENLLSLPRHPVHF